MPRRRSLGYEEARDELIEVVRTLEQGGTTLEESLALWERGEELAQLCQALARRRPRAARRGGRRVLGGLTPKRSARVKRSRGCRSRPA